MNSTIPVLRTAVVIDPPAVNDCFRAYLDTKTRSKCREPGAIITLYEELSKLLNVQFNYSVVGQYGHSSIGENDSVFQMIRDGQVDFVGPDYYFSMARLAIAIPSKPTVYHEDYFYVKAQYPGANYALVNLMGPVVFPLMISSIVAIFLLTTNELKMFATATGLKSFMKVKTFPIILFIATAGMVLNLYASLLSVQCIQQKIRIPKFDNLQHFRRILESGENQIRLVGIGNTGRTRNIEKKIFGGVSRERVRRMRQHFQVVPYVDRVLREAVEHPGVISIINPLFIASSDYWRSECDKLASASAIDVLGRFDGGFYFTKAHRSANLDWFMGLINKNAYALEGLIKVIARRNSMERQVYLKCVNGWIIPPKFSISLNTVWNVGFKMFWLPGFTAASVVGIIELFVAKLFA